MRYLLKDRVLRLDDFLDAATRVAAGGTALDPEIVAALVAPRREDRRLSQLSPREMDVLSLAAEGHSHAGIEIHGSDTSHRRVTAVLSYLGF